MRNELLFSRCSALPRMRGRGVSTSALQRMTRACISLAVWAVAACVALLSPAALAADGSWNVNANGNWATDGSWLDGVNPGSTTTTDSADVATFGFTLTAARAVTVDANRNIGGITFSNTSAFGYSLNTGALRLSDGGVIQTAADNGAHTDTINSAIAIQGDGGSGTFTADATNSASLLSIVGGVTGVSTTGSTTTLTLDGGNTGLNTISGVIGNGSGGGQLAVVKSGTGRWLLSANNTFSGGLTLNDGTLTLGNNDALGAAGSTFTITGGAIDVNAGRTISRNLAQAWNGDFTFLGTNTLNLGTGAVTMNANRTVTVDASTLTVGGAIGDGGLGYGLTKSGTGGLTLSGANTYSGDTTLSAGTLTASNASALGSGTAGLNVNGGTLSIGTGINIARTGAITLAGGTVSGGTLTNNGSALDARSGVISSVLAGTGGVSKTTADTVTLSGNNTFSGGVTLSTGTLRLGNAAALGTGTFTIAGGAIDSTVANLAMANNNPQAWNDDFTFVGTNNLALGTATGVGGAVTLNGNRTVTVNANMLTVQGNIGDGGSGYGITKNGAGELRINGTNTFTGTTTINEGTLSFYQNVALSGTASPLVFNGGGLHIWGTNVTSLDPNRPTTFTSGKTVSLGSQTSLTVSQVLNQGTGGLTITGGSVIPTASNTYTGTTTINNGGTLVISSDANISGTNSPLVFNGGTLQINGTTLTSLNPDRPTTFTSGSTVGFNINTAAHTFTVGQTLDQGTGGFAKAGNGTLALDAANTYTGVTTVSGGVLLLNHANALPGGVGATGGTSNLTLAGGVVGLTSDFSRSIGTSASQVQFGTGGGGWAAFGADRTVNLGGNETPSTIVWGDTIANGGFNGQALILGATTATHTVELVNGLDLGATGRSITLNDGAAAIDAKISGNLSGSGRLTVNGASATSASGGFAAVQLTGANSSFTGGVRVGAAAVLVIDNANALGTGDLQIGTVNTVSSFASNSPTPLTIPNKVVVPSGNHAGYGARIGAAGYTGDLVLAGGLDWTAPTNMGAGINFNGPSTIDLTGALAGPSTNFGLSNETTLRFMADQSAYTNNLGVKQSLGIVAIGHPMGMGSGTKSLNSVVRAEVDLTGTNALTNFSIGNQTGDGAAQGVGTGASFTGTNSIEFAGVDFTGHRTYTNNISGGSLVLSGSVVLKPVTPGKATFFLQGTGNTTFSGNISESSAALITITNTGVTTFSGSNTYTGATSITNGRLVLDYGTQDNSKLSDTAALTLNGAALVLKGGSHTETVASTTLSAGGSTISRDGGTGVLQLNAITRNAQGTLVFGEASIATTDTLNTNGILGGWATVGNDWAVNSTNATDGAITALASYTGALPMTTGANTANYTLTGDQTQTAAVAANTVKITNTGNSETLSLGANNLTITAASATSLGGILYAGGADGNYTIASTTGRIQPTTGGGELIFQTTSGTLTVDAFVGAASATSPVTKGGAGTLVLGAANSFSGALRVNQGALRLTNATGAGTTAGGIVVQNGAALELGNNISVGAEALTITGTGGSGGALRNLAGNTSSYAGAITIGSGGASITSDAGGLLTLSGGVVTASGNNATFGGAGDITMGSAISGAGEVLKNGAGALTLGGAGHAGAFRINAGRLNVNAANALGSAASLSLAAGVTLDNTSAAAVTVNSATLATTLGSSLTFLGTQDLSLGTGPTTLTAASAITVSSGTLTFGGNVGDGGNAYGITKSGVGTLVLSGLTSSAFTGNSVVAAGELYLSGTSTLGGTAATTLTVQNGATLRVGATASKGAVTLVIDGGQVLYESLQDGPVDFTANSVLNSSNANANGVQTIFAGVTVSSAADWLGSIPAAATQGRIVMENGATLRSTNAININADKGIELAGASATFDADTGSIFINSQVTGTGKLVKTGTGGFRILNQANSYAGGTEILEGTFGIYGDGSLGAAGTRVLIDGATLNSGQGTSGQTVTVSSARSIVLGNGKTSNLDATNGSTLAYAGVIAEENPAGTAAALQIGLAGSRAGIVLLGGANTYRGDTIINAGSLKLADGGSFANSPRIIVGDATGSAAATLDLTERTAFSIGASQTLMGKGRVLLGAGTELTVAGLFSPGNSPDLFTYDGGSTTLSGTTLMEIWGTSRGTNPGYDAVNVTNSGLLTLGGTLELNFNQNFPDSTSFTLFDTLTSGSLAGGFGSIAITGVNNDYTGLSFTQAGNVWTTGFNGNNQGLRLTQTASNVTLDVIVVPEPAGIALLASAAVAGWGVWRRRRSCRTEGINADA